MRGTKTNRSGASVNCCLNHRVELLILKKKRKADWRNLILTTRRSNDKNNGLKS